MSKTLFIVRHAHRDKDNGQHFDNGLSEKGHKQAKRILKYFKDHHVEDLDAFSLYSSPKKRCVETLEPLSQETGKKIQILDLVNEGGMIDIKAQEFFKWWIREAPEFTVVSSHGDVIPLIVFYMTGARVDVSKGSLIEITGSSAAPHIVTVLQHP